MCERSWVSKEGASRSFFFGDETRLSRRRRAAGFRRFASGIHLEFSYAPRTFPRRSRAAPLRNRVRHSWLGEASPRRLTIIYLATGAFDDGFDFSGIAPPGVVFRLQLSLVIKVSCGRCWDSGGRLKFYRGER